MRWSIRSEVAWTDMDDRVAVLDLDRLGQPPAVLANSGAEIWRAVVDNPEQDAIVVQVARGYGVNSEQIREQVLAFLTDLEQRHLIVRTN